MKTYHNIAAVFWLTILFQPFFSYGDGAGLCNMGSIEIRQFMLEEKWEGDKRKATYYVSIRNSGCFDTACLPYNVVMWCPGLLSTENISCLPNTALSTLFIAGRDLYVLNEGEAMTPEIDHGFNYTVSLRGIGMLPPIPLQIPIFLHSAEFCSELIPLP